MKRKYLDIDIKYVTYMLNQGWSKSDIADELCISRPTLDRALKFHKSLKNEWIIKED